MYGTYVWDICVGHMYGTYGTLKNGLIYNKYCFVTNDTWTKQTLIDNTQMPQNDLVQWNISHTVYIQFSWVNFIVLWGLCYQARKLVGRFGIISRRNVSRVSSSFYFMIHCVISFASYSKIFFLKIFYTSKLTL